MRYLLDTNILVSAALFPKSVVAQAFFKAVTPPYRAVVCDYSVTELNRVFRLKFPDRIADLERFAVMLRSAVEFVPTPDLENELESKIRDVKDRPILRAAIDAQVDAILTGDKDFLESGITAPKMLTAAEFLAL